MFFHELGFRFDIKNISVLRLANLICFDYACLWEWLCPGGLPGLQNLWRVALRAAVGSNSHPLPLDPAKECHCGLL